VLAPFVDGDQTDFVEGCDFFHGDEITG